MSGNRINSKPNPIPRAASYVIFDAAAEPAKNRKGLRRLKGTFLWKLTLPARRLVRFSQRTLRRIRNLGSLRGFYIKARGKMLERRKRLDFGTRSYPDAARRKAEENTVFSKKVLFSILVPLYNTPDIFLREMIDSVQAQTYAGWELCLADGSDEKHRSVEAIVRSYMKRDPRIRYERLEKNLGISGNTNHCYRMSRGDYLALFDHDDVLHPSVLFEYMKRICEEDADYLYCDEATFEGPSVNRMITLHFKPDYAPDNLRANNYICHFSAFSRKLLESDPLFQKEGELFRTRMDGSQDHDMILRLTSRAEHVVHVPKLLYYWRSHKGSVASDISAKSYAIEAARRAVADHLESCGFRNFTIESTRAFETIFRIRYEIQGNPLVSILIPNRDHEEDLRRCIGSILEKSTYRNFEILILENGSTREGILSYYRELECLGGEGGPKIRILTYDREFNYSAVNNFGAAQAKGAYLILLNNDTEVASPGWIEELLMYAQRPDVGAVGAKLYYPDRTIQHAGIVLGLGAHRTAGHVFYGFEGRNLGYMGKLWYQQNVSAVTGACLMVRKEVYDRVSGLDEGFRIALNDVDFCLRLRELGLLNVWNPYCELFHYESASRGSDVDGADSARAKRYKAECARFRERWGEVLKAGDPYYNPNLTLDRADCTLKYR
ncbi:MAG: glycosyltransferase family 2 protein [Lachnospiraceae bacterium]|nr:glycosyltransferase family 2 protein [Lachnospiraceae bacterium]